MKGNEHRNKKRASKKHQEIPDEPPDVIVDTEIYEVDRLADSKLVGNQLFYLVKWRNYTEEDDSWEPELRLTCDGKLVDFAKSLIDLKKYILSIPSSLENLENMSPEDLKSLESLSIFAQTTVFCGYVKFALGDTMGSRFMFLKYLRDTNQTYLLHSAHLPSKEVLEDSMDQYAKELSYLLSVFPEHPLVKIVAPHTYESVFYAPPPLAHLLFEPVTAEMFERKNMINHLFVPGSKTEGFNKVRPFIRKSEFKHTVLEDPRTRVDVELPYRGMKRLNYAADPRFPASLELVHDNTRGWTLKALTTILEDTPIIQMTGVIRPVSYAHRSLQEEGERVAFSSFIEIPGTGMCLDRRQLYDFSKFIPHSCEPTCSVRLVESGNKIPDLVVYAKVDINEFSLFTISLDYFKGFDLDVKRHFARNHAPDGKIFGLYENNIDFVHCQCLMTDCREILYVDQSLSRDDKTVSKKTKLYDLDPDFMFTGMKVCESEKIWTITDAMFDEKEKEEDV